MQFGTHPLPYDLTRLYGSPPYSLNGYDGSISVTYELIRLQQAKAILSKGLADCVTYLTVLREKQTRNAQQLSTEASAPQKRKKRWQQNKRHLDNEIRNRERDELAFLNNLQACEANIYLENVRAYHTALTYHQTTEVGSAPDLYTPTLCSYSGSEYTELTWDGWHDETMVSPFQKRSSKPFSVDEVAPDAFPDEPRRDSVITKDVKCPPPLSRDTVESSNSLPVPPNTAASHFKYSSVLRSEATVFKAAAGPAAQLEDRCGSEFNRLSMSSSMVTSCIELLEKRRFTIADIEPILQRFSIDVGPYQQTLPRQSCCPATPQRRAQGESGAQMSRQRTSSL